MARLQSPPKLAIVGDLTSAELAHVVRELTVVAEDLGRRRVRSATVCTLAVHDRLGIDVQPINPGSKLVTSW